jgi:hypothetical protein
MGVFILGIDYSRDCEPVWETFEKLLFTFLHELFDPSAGLLTKS